ncbi:MAG: hypothetical protein DWH75_01525 [Planctomycetota bacterium]|nr:MAG: hypothetical protein DWH75_01525 [Planctomycetota bacterium]
MIRSARGTPAIRARAVIALAACATLAACTRNPYDDAIWYWAPEPGSTLVPRVQSGPRSLAMFRGDNGAPLDWNALSNGIRWADIVVVGEQHDDANAHGVQQAIVDEAFAMWPGSAVSLEMLERNEQPIVDAYLNDQITMTEFIDRTESRDWATKGSWEKFYQPVIDSAKAAHAPVIAANAPRAYVRRARTEGYAALKALPPEEQAMFSIPQRDPPDSYRARFKALMSDNGAHAVDEEKLDEVLRSQRLWDATMADSVVRAYQAAPTDAKIIHLVGQFHSENDGGLISEIQARAPFANVLTVTVQKGETLALRDEDKGKADVVIYGVNQAPAWRNFEAVKETAKPLPAAAAEAVIPTWGFAY